MSWSDYELGSSVPKPVVATEPGVLGRDFTWCEKPDCERLVYKGVLYCCTPCAHAGEHKYEIVAHNPTCDERWNERKALVEKGRFSA